MKRTRAFAVFAVAASLPLVAAIAVSDTSTSWTMQRTERGVVFAMSPASAPEGVRLGLFCNGPQPSMIALVDGESAPRLTVGLHTAEGEASAALKFQANSRSYGGPIPAALTQLLTGAAGTALVSVQQGQYFNLSLVGSSAQVTKALASCWTRPAQPTIKPAPPIKGAVGPLGIAPGHYVSSLTACKDPIEVFFYDGKRAGMVDPEGKFPVRGVGKVTRNADGSLYLSAHEIELRKLSGGQISLSIQDISPPMRVCPAAELPREWRVK